MKTFYRSASLLCLFLVTLTIFSGIAAADDPRENSLNIIELRGPVEAFYYGIDDNMITETLRYYPFVGMPIGSNITENSIEEGEPEIPEEEEPL